MPTTTTSGVANHSQSNTYPDTTICSWNTGEHSMDASSGSYRKVSQWATVISKRRASGESFQHSFTYPRLKESRHRGNDLVLKLKGDHRSTHDGWHVGWAGFVFKIFKRMPKSTAHATDME